MQEGTFLRYLFVISIKKIQETRLGAGRSLDTSKSKVVACTLDIPQIPQEFL